MELCVEHQLCPSNRSIQTPPQGTISSLAIQYSWVNTTLDGHYRYNWYPWPLKSVVLFSNHLLGPKVNTVEKLGELRRAGINVGMCVLVTHLFYVFILSPYEFLPRVI